jgi:ribosomal protein L29
MPKKTDNLKEGNLTEKLITLRESVRVIRFDKSGTKSKNVKELKNQKRQIARILTEMNKSNKNK